MTAADIIRWLSLKPLPVEGGYFRETFRSPHAVPAAGGSRSLSTAIYYLLAPGTFSAMHRLPGDEVFHFYLGDPVEMLQLRADGTGERVVLGAGIERGEALQVVVPGGVWQGTRLLSGGAFALLGTTMAPGFDVRDYEAGDREVLLAGYPAHAALVTALTR